MLKPHLKTWVSSQYSARLGLSPAGHIPVFQEHVLVKCIISKAPSAQHPDTTTSPKDRGAELLHLLPTYQNWFYREADFYFIYLFLKRELMKSTGTGTAFLSASWTSLPRSQNETSQHSKGLWDEKLIPKPTGKGKWFERFGCDLLLKLERRCWSPGSAAILCLWLSRWYYINDCGCKLIDATFLINPDYLAKE